MIHNTSNFVVARNNVKPCHSPELGDAPLQYLAFLEGPIGGYERPPWGACACLKSMTMTLAKNKATDF